MVRTQTRTEGRLCGDTGRRWPSIGQGERPQETNIDLNPPDPRTGRRQVFVVPAALPEIFTVAPELQQVRTPPSSQGKFCRLSDRRATEQPRVPRREPQSASAVKTHQLLCHMCGPSPVELQTGPNVSCPCPQPPWCTDLANGFTQPTNQDAGPAHQVSENPTQDGLNMSAHTPGTWIQVEFRCGLTQSSGCLG